MVLTAFDHRIAMSAVIRAIASACAVAPMIRSAGSFDENHSARNIAACDCCGSSVILPGGKLGQIKSLTYFIDE
jgi:hypothetical protein